MRTWISVCLLIFFALMLHLGMHVRVYQHGTSNPCPDFLCPITPVVIAHQILKEKENISPYTYQHIHISIHISAYIHTHISTHISAHTYQQIPYQHTFISIHISVYILLTMPLFCPFSAIMNRSFLSNILEHWEPLVLMSLWTYYKQDM